jgi:hypothetical protein
MICHVAGLILLGISFGGKPKDLFYLGLAGSVKRGTPRHLAPYRLTLMADASQYLSDLETWLSPAARS